MNMKSYFVVLFAIDFMLIIIVGCVVLLGGLQKTLMCYGDKLECNKYVATVTNTDIYDEDNIKIEKTNLVLSDDGDTNRKVNVIITTAMDEYYHSECVIESKSDIVCLQDGKEIKCGKSVKVAEYTDSNLVLSSSKGFTVSDVHNDEYIYKGKLKTYWTSKGIIIVNQTNIEDYIKGVVAAEMPDSFEGEAKKAQAITSRSYCLANLRKLKIDNVSADLDDSTRYQVFGRENPSKDTIKAVDDTKNIIMKKNNNILNATFFSTSCGYTADSSVWGDEKKNIQSRYIGKKVNAINVSKGDFFEKYIASKPEAYEKECSYFRWRTIINKDRIQRNLEAIGANIGLIKNIKIQSRGAGGIVVSLSFIGKEGVFESHNQYQIRTLLSPKGGNLILNDKRTIKGTNLLPSAFITIEKLNDNNYLVIGGGYGHGVGMSQYGAQKMAESGENYKKILKQFYE